jgi:hypothetical protein
MSIIRVAEVLSNLSALISALFIRMQNLFVLLLHLCLYRERGRNNMVIS